MRSFSIASAELSKVLRSESLVIIVVFVNTFCVEELSCAASKSNGKAPADAAVPFINSRLDNFINSPLLNLAYAYANSCGRFAIKSIIFDLILSDDGLEPERYDFPALVNGSKTGRRLS